VHSEKKELLLDPPVPFAAAVQPSTAVEEVELVESAGVAVVVAVVVAAAVAAVVVAAGPVVVGPAAVVAAAAVAAVAAVELAAALGTSEDRNWVAEGCPTIENPW